MPGLLALVALLRLLLLSLPLAPILRLLLLLLALSGSLTGQLVQLELQLLTRSKGGLQLLRQVTDLHKRQQTHSYSSRRPLL